MLLRIIIVVIGLLSLSACSSGGSAGKNPGTTGIAVQGHFDLTASYGNTATSTITVTNNSGGPLAISNFSTNTTSKQDPFHVNPNTCTSSLGTNAQCTFIISYTAPTKGGVVHSSGTVSFTYGSQTYSHAITGTAEDGVTITQDHTNFATKLPYILVTITPTASTVKITKISFNSFSYAGASGTFPGETGSCKLNTSSPCLIDITNINAPSNRTSKTYSNAITVTYTLNGISKTKSSGIIINNVPAIVLGNNAALGGQLYWQQAKTPIQTIAASGGMPGWQTYSLDKTGAITAVGAGFAGSSHSSINPAFFVSSYNGTSSTIWYSNIFALGTKDAFINLLTLPGEKVTKLMGYQAVNTPYFYAIAQTEAGKLYSLSANSDTPAPITVPAGLTNLHTVLMSSSSDTATLYLYGLNSGTPELYKASWSVTGGPAKAPSITLSPVTGFKDLPAGATVNGIGYSNDHLVLYGATAADKGFIWSMLTANGNTTVLQDSTSFPLGSDVTALTGVDQTALDYITYKKDGNATVVKVTDLFDSNRKQFSLPAVTDAAAVSVDRIVPYVGSISSLGLPLTIAVTEPPSTNHYIFQYRKDGKTWTPIEPSSVSGSINKFGFTVK